MRNLLKRGASFFVIGSLLPLAAGAQAPLIHTPGYSINLLTLNQETGVGYEPVATATFACRIYDWQKKVVWGDGTPIEFLTHKVQAGPGGATAPGTYDLFGTHVYGKAGSYNVLAELWVGCPGVTGTILLDQETYVVNVFDRLPVKSFTAPPTVNRGQALNLMINLFADAPPSGTKFFLTTDKPTAFSSFAGAMVVPPKANSAQVTVTIAGDAPIGPLEITAIGGDGPHKTKIIVK